MGAELEVVVEPPATAELATAPVAPAVVGPPSAGEWKALMEQAHVLARSGLVPAALRGKPDDIVVVALTGRDLGIPPMMAMRHIFVIDGKPSLDAGGMVALARRAGHSIRDVTPEDEQAKRAIAHGRRADNGDEFTCSFSLEDAARAGLAGKGVWKSYPGDMMWARAVSKLCRRLFPDVLMGISYTPEELDSTPDGGGWDDYAGPGVGQAERDALLAEIAELHEDDRAALREWWKASDHPSMASPNLMAPTVAAVRDQMATLVSERAKPSEVAASEDAGEDSGENGLRGSGPGQPESEPALIEVPANLSGDDLNLWIGTDKLRAEAAWAIEKVRARGPRKGVQTLVSGLLNGVPVPEDEPVPEYATTREDVCCSCGTIGEVEEVDSQLWCPECRPF